MTIVDSFDDGAVAGVKTTDAETRQGFIVGNRLEIFGDGFVNLIEFKALFFKCCAEGVRIDGVDSDGDTIIIHNDPPKMYRCEC